MTSTVPPQQALAAGAHPGVVSRGPDARARKGRGLAGSVLVPGTNAWSAQLKRGTLIWTMDERPLATPEYEQDALSRFRLSLSAEEFAARFGHYFALFNFQKYRYRTPGMTEWVDRLSAFFCAEGLPTRLRGAREKYLTDEEIARVEAFERDPF